jgi:hypothetical protein
MPSITKTNSTITFANDDAIYQVNTAGRSISLFAVQNNQNVALSEKGSSFALLYINTPDGRKSFSSNGLDYVPLNGSSDEGMLEVRFPYAVAMTIHCKAEPDHFSFKLQSIANTGTVPGPVPVIAAAMVQIILPGDAYGGFMGAIWQNDYLVAQVALHEKTHVHSTLISKKNPSDNTKRYAILTTSFAAVQLEGAKMALVVCPNDQWLCRMKALETRYHLPHYEIGGVWDKQHPEVKSSYLFVDLTLDNHLEIIKYAKKGGFRHVMPYRWNWSEHVGTYDLINEEHYGGQLANLQLVSTALQNEGLALGLHVMALMVGKTDPLVRPVPDAGLAKFPSGLVLAEDIDDSVAEIPVSQVTDPDDPEQYDRFIQAVGSGQRDIIIDDEIIAVESVASNGNLLVERGAYGNTPVAHDAGAPIRRLPEFFKCYLADPGTDLPDRIAQKFAAVCQDVGVRLVFLDGSEGTRHLLPARVPWVDNWYWYASYQAAEAYREYLPEVLLHGSGISSENIGYPWQLYTRGSSGDYATYAVEAFMDHSRIGRYRDNVYHRASFPQELGWIALLARVYDRRWLNASFAATTTDEIEYQLNRALGFNLPISLESNLEELRENGFSNDIFAMIGQYEKLRRQYRVPAALREKLQYPDREFRQQHGLLKDQYHLQSVNFISFPGLRLAVCRFRRRAYLEKVLAPDQSWKFSNPFQQQPLQVKITALPSHQAFEDEGNILLIVNLDGSFQPLSAGSAIPGNGYQITEDGAIQVTQVSTDFGDRHKWCSFRKAFDNPLDLSQYKVIGLYLEPIANADEAVVCVKLVDRNGFLRAFQIVVDFSGERYIEFPLPTGAEFFDYQPPNKQGLVFRWFQWSRVTGMEIYVKNILSPGLKIKIHSVKAIKQEFAPLKDPLIELDGKTIQFPSVLKPIDGILKAEPWDFLIYNGLTFDRFNGNNQLVDNGVHQPIIRPVAIPPVVASGSNTLTFRHRGQNKALMRIILENQTENWIFRKA